jgi:hypothetical protein
MFNYFSKQSRLNRMKVKLAEARAELKAVESFVGVKSGGYTPSEARRIVHLESYIAGLLVEIQILEGEINV